MDQTELNSLIELEYGNIAGITVLKNGTPVYEESFNGIALDTQIEIYSCTKSITSILIGIAMDQGLIKDVHQPVLSFFPDYQIKRGEHVIQTVTLENMLTMTAPYKYKSAPYTRYFSSMDWVKTSLDLLGGKTPAGTFRYAPLSGPDILSGILRSVSGKTVLEYARENLFDPLDIHVPGSIVFHSREEQMAYYKKISVPGWVADESGNNTAAWGLHLSSGELARIGQMMLNDGMWNGKQIISSSWIKDSTSQHACWKERNLPYGYLWWLGDHGYSAMGDCGNVLFVDVKRQMVIAITSLRDVHAKDRIPLILNAIIPSFSD